MQILKIIIQRIIEAILLFIGKYFISRVQKHIDLKEQRKKEQEALKNYQEVAGGKADDSKVLETERDLLNGDNSSIMR